MLNIGNLNTKARVYSAAAATDLFGQQTDTTTAEAYFFCRVLQKKISTDFVAEAKTLTNEIEIICRYNAILMPYDNQFKFYGDTGGNSSTSGTYIVLGVEELGRKEGLKIKLIKRMTPIDTN